MQDIASIGRPLMPKKIDKLELIREELNDYAAALGDRFHPLSKTPYELFCVCEQARLHFERKGKMIPTVGITSAVNCTPEQWSEATSALIQVAEYCPNSVRSNPWYGCDPSGTGLLFQNEIKTEL